MAGLFGNGDAGLLSSARPQYSTADKIGLLGSVLQDGLAGYWGRQGGNVDSTINQLQSKNVQSRLISDLQSTDPTVRQRAYMFAQINGIDTKPFQQQQATQQLPALLQSMRPSQQTFNSQSAPLPQGGNITTAPINFEAPGMNIQDAIAQAPPELQGQFAPKLLEQQMAAEAEANKPFELSPGQVRFGAGGQQIAALPEKATPNSPFNPDGTPNVAFQKYTKDLKAFEQAPTWANIGIQKQKLANAASGVIDPDSIGFMADQVLSGDKSPFQNLGRGQQGANNIAALRREVMTRAKARGLGGSDLASLNAEFSGLQAGERTLGTRTANIEMAASEAQSLMPLALAASKAVPRTQYPTLNRVLLAAEQGTGDENVVRLGVSVNGLVNTYARAISPTGNPTVSDKDHAREILDKAWANGQFEAAVGQMDKEIQAARKSPGSVRGEFRSAISGHRAGNAAVPDAMGTQLRSPPQLPPQVTPRLSPTNAPKIRTYNPATGRLE